VDFGNGLYIYDSAINKYVLVGLASYFNFNGGCALPGNPGYVESKYIFIYLNDFSTIEFIQE
jgi:hypothetical protein